MPAASVLSCGWPVAPRRRGGCEDAPASRRHAVAGEAAAGVLVRDVAEREVGKGLASWYGKGFHGRRTASGERFDMHALTAAHPTLPFGTLVRVRSLEDGRTVDVRINDRGPWMKRRVIDLSRAAADALGLIDLGAGTRRVVLSVLSAPEKKDSSSR